MAQIIDRRPPRCSYFLGCFRRSSGGSPENKHSHEKGEIATEMKKSGTMWFSWSKLKKSPPIKTVPFDGTTGEKVHPRKGSIFLIKSSKKVHKDRTPGSVTQKIVHDKPNKTKYDNVQEIILENSKSMNHLDSMEELGTCTKDQSAISKCRSQNSISNVPISPEEKFEVSREMVALPHSVVMPPPMRKKTVNISGGDSKAKIEGKTSRRKTEASRLDQFVGISIIVVALIIMVFCGKICAILCTSAWFYFYPLVRGQNEPKVDQENGPKSGDKLDFNSREYKKKVVLEGFLERNHRIH